VKRSGPEDWWQVGFLGPRSVKTFMRPRGSIIEAAQPADGPVHGQFVIEELWTLSVCFASAGRKAREAVAFAQGIPTSLC
jgi:hypothetical protein